jgi:GTPase SAR1 family protein
MQTTEPVKKYVNDNITTLSSIQTNIQQILKSIHLLRLSEEKIRDILEHKDDKKVLFNSLCDAVENINNYQTKDYYNITMDIYNNNDANKLKELINNSVLLQNEIKRVTELG